MNLVRRHRRNGAAVTGVQHICVSWRSRLHYHRAFHTDERISDRRVVVPGNVLTSIQGQHDRTHVLAFHDGLVPSNIQRHADLALPHSHLSLSESLRTNGCPSRRTITSLFSNW